MDENTDKKLSDNATRVAAIGALRQIHKQVKSFNDQERNNKRKAIALIIITLIFAASLMCYFMPDKMASIPLSSSPNQPKAST